MRISDWSSTCALPICGIHRPCRAPSGLRTVADTRHGDAGRARAVEHRRRSRQRGARVRSVAARRMTDGGRKVICVEYHRRSEEHTSELQSLMRISYAVFCLKKKTTYEKHLTNMSIKAD